AENSWRARWQLRAFDRIIGFGDDSPRQTSAANVQLSLQSKRLRWEMTFSG
uniref:Type VI secretion system protein ImpL n=1 Tax=Steinernema glaseri TaxID=37863 RepID=A0A1I8AJN3_9BILA